MNTRSIKKGEIEAKWYVIDASKKRLGKVATTAAALLNGKSAVNAVDYLEPGTRVIVLNCEKLDIFPKKLKNKLYRRHSGFIGGLKEKTLEQMMSKTPEKVIELAVKRMLPQTKMGQKMYTNLFVYKGNEHKYEAQKPELVEIK